MIYYYKANSSKSIIPFRIWVSAFFILLTVWSCQREEQEEEEVLTVLKSSTKSLTYFAFLSAENPHYLTEDVIFDLSDTTNLIVSGRIPNYVAIDSLIATFKTTGVAVSVNNITQHSDTTANDYSSGLKYVVQAENGETNEYTIKVQVFTGLPVLTIETENGVPIVSKYDYVKATYVLDGFGILPDVSGILEIQGRGNSTFQMPKKPYQMKLDKKTAMLGPTFGQDKKWLLLANYSDKTMLRTETAFAMSRLSNLDFTPASRFVELFLNGSYDGTYQLMQKIEVSASRVNITKNGFLLEVDQLTRMTDDDVYFETSRHLFNIKEPELAVDGTQYDQIKNFITEAEDALYGPDFKDPENGYARYLDIESFVDWYLINEISRNNDAVFFSSCYMNLAPGGKLKMGPVWDFDIAFGNVDYNGNESPTGFYIKNADTWIKRLFEDPAFASLVKTRFKYFLSNKASIIKQIDGNTSTLHFSAAENNDRWNTMGIYVWPNAVVFDTYEEETRYLKQWINVRMSWLATAFENIQNSSAKETNEKGRLR